MFEGRWNDNILKYLNINLINGESHPKTQHNLHEPKCKSSLEKLL